MITGIALLLHSYSTKDYQHIFGGTFIAGLGIHFHGLQHTLNWPDHWAVYPFMIGISFLIRSFWTKSQLIIGVILTGGFAFIIFSERIPEWLHWIDHPTGFLDRFWPITLILLGFYLLKKKR